MENEEYQTGQTFVIGGYTLRIMGIIEGWIICRYKRSAPFVKHKNEFKQYLEKQQRICTPSK